MSTQEPIPLLSLGAGKEVRCTEYNCAAAIILETLKPAVEIAWDKISESARDILHDHWKNGLWITLVWGSYDWAKPDFGYATTEPKGHSMFCWSNVLRDIPQSVLVTTVAHEFGHMAFIAIGEPAHAEKKKTQAEYLIAELLKEWDLNQEEADLWVSANFWEFQCPLERLDNPLVGAGLEEVRKKNQAKVESKAAEREAYRASVQDYFDRVAGKRTGHEYADERERHHPRDPQTPPPAQPWQHFAS